MENGLRKKQKLKMINQPVFNKCKFSYFFCSMYFEKFIMGQYCAIIKSPFNPLVHPSWKISV